ncbi:MAG: hypothetical protein EPO55_22135 [Reyranella sp.]|uniref:hypothetical protein n=1 Tax=Reyranella sp. TaxID=1929291 RepID=UPI0012089990|nr:hypothetical protein [Reyranella sp.]TAJ36397.1 MAG: hypothetical protein EPO55_22135 [Reyranella sp.]
MGGLEKLVVVAACVLAMTSCASDPSFQVAAMEASDSGDQKAATVLARKEVARFATADQCSPKVTVNCGTLALAYGTLARYQILDGDRMGGESSFRSAKAALRLTGLETRASATGVVYGDVSEAFWKAGDRARAIDVFKEGRTAGADQYLYMTSAARFVDQQQQQQQQQPTDQPPPTAPGPSVQATTRTAGTAPASSPLQPTPLQPTPLQPSPLQPTR